MYTIIAATLEDTEGLGYDGLFLIKRLHGEHSLAIYPIGIGIGEGALSSIGIDDLCLVVLDTFACNGSSLIIQIHSRIAFRTITTGNIGRKSQTWGKFHYIIFGSNFKPRNKFFGEFSPPWAQYTFAQFGEHPVPLVLIEFIFGIHNA